MLKLEYCRGKKGTTLDSGVLLQEVGTLEDMSLTASLYFMSSVPEIHQRSGTMVNSGIVPEKIQHVSR